MTVRPRGPSVTFTASASASMPRRMRSRAASPKSSWRPAIVVEGVSGGQGGARRARAGAGVRPAPSSPLPRVPRVQARSAASSTISTSRLSTQAAQSANAVKERLTVSCATPSRLAMSRRLMRRYRRRDDWPRSAMQPASQTRKRQARLGRHRGHHLGHFAGAHQLAAEGELQRMVERGEALAPAIELAQRQEKAVESSSAITVAVWWPRLTASKPSTSPGRRRRAPARSRLPRSSRTEAARAHHQHALGLRALVQQRRAGARARRSRRSPRRWVGPGPQPMVRSNSGSEAGAEVVTALRCTNQAPAPGAIGLTLVEVASMLVSVA